jgi:hypothetical protein
MSSLLGDPRLPGGATKQSSGFHASVAIQKNASSSESGQRDKTDKTMEVRMEQA